MSRYFIDQDYSPIVQTDQLQIQLVQRNHNTLIQTEKIAQETVFSYLQQHFLIDKEFTDTSIWSNSTTYSAASRVYLDATTYSIGITYSLNQLTTYNKQVYSATGTTSGTFSSNDWSLLGNQYDIFYSPYPAPYFDYTTTYYKDDIVYYEGFTWSCQIASANISQSDAEQFYSINNVPYINVFPNDKRNNVNNKFWMPGATYSVPAGTPLSDTRYWINGDNRSQLIKLHTMAIVLYILNKNVAPMNIPQHRDVAYQEALNFFKDLALGKKNSPMLKYQPTQGNIVRYGGNIKKSTAW